MKLFDHLSDVERHVGCSIIIPDWYVGDCWLIFESDKPYTYRFVDYSADIDIHKNSDHSKDWLVLNPNTFYKTTLSNINMEQYIASYNHLIGCEVYDIDYGSFTIRSVFKNESCGLFFNDNENEPFDSLVSFYLDDENLGTYEEYMQLHYPEYKHVWSKQL